MMPKGVEHLRLEKLPYLTGRVRIPMMPKGVEHEENTCAANAAVLNAFRHHRATKTALPLPSGSDCVKYRDTANSLAVTLLRLRYAAPSGSSTRNVVPFPGSLSTSMFAP